MLPRIGVAAQEGEWAGAGFLIRREYLQRIRVKKVLVLRTVPLKGSCIVWVFACVVRCGASVLRIDSRSWRLRALYVLPPITFVVLSRVERRHPSTSFIGSHCLRGAVKGEGAIVYQPAPEIYSCLQLGSKLNFCVPSQRIVL